MSSIVKETNSDFRNVPTNPNNNKALSCITDNEFALLLLLLIDSIILRKSPSNGSLRIWAGSNLFFIPFQTSVFQDNFCRKAV